MAEKNSENGRPHGREKFGGFTGGRPSSVGSSTAVSVLLLALVSAIGGPIAGSSFRTGQQAASSAGTIGIIAGIVFLLVLALAYYAGGYVAGRMSRFDGGRQGLGVLDHRFGNHDSPGHRRSDPRLPVNVLSQLSLPTVPNAGSLGIGALVTLVLVLAVTVLAAMGGGKAGRRYHRTVDRAIDA
jgi:hypothetical protein